MWRWLAARARGSTPPTVAVCLMLARALRLTPLVMAILRLSPRFTMPPLDFCTPQICITLRHQPSLAHACWNVHHGRATFSCVILALKPSKPRSSLPVATLTPKIQPNKPHSLLATIRFMDARWARCQSQPAKPIAHPICPCLM